MRKFGILFLFLLVFMTVAEAAVHRVGTYNVRYPAETDTAEKSWNSRKPYVVKMLKDTMNYDVVALQEVYNSGYYSYLKDKMDAYTFYTNTDVYGVALAYRTSKYTCLDKGYFKLVPSPKPKDWEQLQTRWAVWVKLQDKSSGEIFYFASTHLDLYPVAIREGARIVTERMREMAGDYPCLFAGDMNCEQFEHDPHANFGLYFGNARQMSKTDPQGSFYSFASGMNPNNASKLLDYLYVRNVEVESYFVNNSTMGRKCGLMPSDHMPLMCEVTLLPLTRKTTHVVRNVDELLKAAKALQPNDILYLRDGTYDLGDTTLTLANTCVMEGGENVVLTGRNQLVTGARFVSLEIRDITFKDATCPVDINGAVVGLNGNYLTMSNCRVEGCTTLSSGMIYVKDCALNMDYCALVNNVSEKHEGGVYITGCDRYSTSIQHTQFVNNMSNLAPAIYYESTATAYLYANSFIGNTSKTSGALTIRATENVSDIRLVNNTFARNTINVKAGFGDANVGGSAIWQEMGKAGRLTLMNNTIVGNYAASRMSDGSSSSRFLSGTIHSLSGTLSLSNNIIAGNYSSCVGRGDLSMVDSNNLIRSMNNIFSSADNMNCPIATGNFAADNYTEACTELQALLGGEVLDSVYVPAINIYGEDQNVLAVAPLVNTYAGQIITSLDANAMSAVTIDSDILNKGEKSGTLIVDQAGYTRADLTVPGSMEIGAEPTELSEMHNSQCTMQNSKFILNGQLYIQHNGRLYNVLGF